MKLNSNIIDPLQFKFPGKIMFRNSTLIEKA